jgi:hypothetical protein
VANDQGAVTIQDTPVGITLTGTDLETPIADLEFFILGSPAHGTLTGTGPNRVYTPHQGFTGNDDFSFVINDGQVDSPAGTVAISITPASPPPASVLIDDASDNPPVDDSNDSDDDNGFGIDLDEPELKLIENPGAPINTTSVASPEELGFLEGILEESLGVDLQVLADPFLELVSSDGPEGELKMVLPIMNVPQRELTGDIDFTLGNLQVQTDAAGHLTATLRLGEGLSLIESKLVGNAAGMLELIFVNPRLRYEVTPQGVADLAGGDPGISHIGASLDIDLKRLPGNTSLTATFAKELEHLIQDPQFKLELLADSLDQPVRILEEDVAFLVEVGKQNITNDDLGDTRVTLEVSRAWYESKRAEGKAIFIAKFDDQGEPLTPPEEVTDQCQVIGDGSVMACQSRFTGAKGGLSGMALLAIALPKTPGPAADLLPLGDSLVRAFHFDTIRQEWLIYDPRRGFEEANTLESLTPGASYWINVAGARELTLNGQERDLKDGWNVLTW